MHLRRSLALALLAAAAAAPADAGEGEEPARPKPAPAAPAKPDPAAPAPAPVDGDAAVQAPVRRVDEKAMELLRRADRAVHFARNARVDSVKGALVIPKSQIGRLAVNFDWARGEDGGEGTLELSLHASIREELRPLLEEQVHPKVRPLLDTMFLGRRLQDIFARCHTDYRTTESGEAEVVLTYTDGPASGASETLTFQKESGLLDRQVTRRPDGTTASTTTRRYEKYGERSRLTGMTMQTEGLGGVPLSIEFALEWLDCDGIAIPWRMTQDVPLTGKVEFLLEAVVVNGKPYRTPKELESLPATDTPAPGTPKGGGAGEGK